MAHEADPQGRVSVLHRRKLYYSSHAPRARVWCCYDLSPRKQKHAMRVLTVANETPAMPYVQLIGLILEKCNNSAAYVILNWQTPLMVSDYTRIAE